MKKENVVWYDRKRYLWFPFSFTKYWVKNGRLYIQKGFFNTNYDETLLYRIVDISLSRSLSQKLFGTGTIILTTRADADKKIHLINISKSEETKDLLSQLIEEARSAKNISGKEFLEIRHTDELDDFEEDE